MRQVPAVLFVALAFASAGLCEPAATASRRRPPASRQPKTIETLGPAPVRLGAGTDPRIAVDAAANPVAVWQDGGEVRGWRYLGDRAVELHVASDAATVAGPDVAAAAGGRFAVTWSAEGPNGTVLAAASYDSAGNPARPRFAVAEASPGRVQTGADVAMRGDGSGWAVAWVERVAGESVSEVWLRAFDAADQPTREPFLLTATPSSAAAVRELIALDGGGWAVLWNEGATAAAAVLHLRAFDAAGEPSGAVLVLSEAAAFGDMIASTTGIITFHVESTDLADGRYQWLRTEVDNSGRRLGSSTPRFPDFVCPRAIAAAAASAPREELACYGELQFGEDDRLYLQLHPPSTGSVEEFAVVACHRLEAPRCDDLQMAEPAGYAVTVNGTIRSSWVLAWDDGRDVWLHRWPFGGSGYVRFVPGETRVTPGQALRLGLNYNIIGRGSSVRVRTIPGGPDAATPGVDYAPIDTVVQWSSTSQDPRRFVTLETFDDGDARPETVTLELSEPGNGALIGGPSRYVATLAGPPPCVPGPTTLCLLGGRFRVRGEITNQYSGTTAAAESLAYSDLTGFLYLGDARNPELAIKVLDFGNEVFKVFYAQLTDFRYVLEVADMESGTVRTYRNTPGDCGGLDNDLLAGRHATRPAPPASRFAADCPSGELCVLGGRYAVAVEWSNPGAGVGGAARPEALSDFSGLFTFDDPRNVELIVKLLDFGDRVLFLSGAMSNLPYRIRVRDLETGSEKTYDNPAGRFCGFLDGHAF